MIRENIINEVIHEMSENNRRLDILNYLIKEKNMDKIEAKAYLNDMFKRSIVFTTKRSSIQELSKHV